VVDAEELNVVELLKLEVALKADVVFWTAGGGVEGGGLGIGVGAGDGA
jgi:hypothetical protein